MPNPEPEVAILQAASPCLRERLHAARLALHQRTPEWCHYSESACAVSYAVHEVFHLSVLLVPTAIGLLIVLTLRALTVPTLPVPLPRPREKK